MLKSLIRDWSLITGRWGYKTGVGVGGGQVMFYKKKKKGVGGVENVLAMLKGGHKKF